MNAIPPRSPWPAAIVAFFALAIVALISFVVFAAGHGMDLVRPDYYEHELRYQSHLDMLRRTGKLPGRVQLAYRSGEARLDVLLPRGAGASPAKAKVELYRPSNARLDRHLDLNPDEQGRDSVRVEGLLPGLWKIRVRWFADETEYFEEQALLIESPPGRL